MDVPTGDAPEVGYTLGMPRAQYMPAANVHIVRGSQMMGFKQRTDEREVQS